MYDALQLKACGISLASGRTYTPEPCKYQAAAIKENWLNDPDISVYVDPVKGDDDNPGTSDKPVKTIEEAVRIYRYKKTSKSDQGLISLAVGTYFLTDTINLTTEDSNLVILGESSDNTFISGGKQYKFDWKTFLREMRPLEMDTDLMNAALDNTEGNTGKAKQFGKVANASDCQAACKKDTTCFAFTWYDDSFGELSNTCYFHFDGSWTPTCTKGAISGRQVNIVVADLSSQDPTPFTTLFLNGQRAVRARYPDGNPETTGLHQSNWLCVICSEMAPTCFKNGSLHNRS